MLSFTNHARRVIASMASVLKNKENMTVQNLRVLRKQQFDKFIDLFFE